MNVNHNRKAVLLMREWLYIGFWILFGYLMLCVILGCSSVQTPPWDEVPDVETVPIVIFKY